MLSMTNMSAYQQRQEHHAKNSTRQKLGSVNVNKAAKKALKLLFSSNSNKAPFDTLQDIKAIKVISESAQSPFDGKQAIYAHMPQSLRPALRPLLE